MPAIPVRCGGGGNRGRGGGRGGGEAQDLGGRGAGEGEGGGRGQGRRARPRRGRADGGGVRRRLRGAPRLRRTPGRALPLGPRQDARGGRGRRRRAPPPRAPPRPLPPLRRRGPHPSPEPLRAAPPRGRGAVRGGARRPPAPAPVQAGRGGRAQGEARGGHQPPQRAPPPPPPLQAERPRGRADGGAVHLLRRAGPCGDAGVRGAPRAPDARGGAGARGGHPVAHQDPGVLPAAGQARAGGARHARPSRRLRARVLLPGRLPLVAAGPRLVPAGAVRAVPRHARDGARGAAGRAPDLRLRPLRRRQVHGAPAAARGGGRPGRRRAPEGSQRRRAPADALLRGVPARGQGRVVAAPAGLRAGAAAQPLRGRPRRGVPPGVHGERDRCAPARRRRNGRRVRGHAGVPAGERRCRARPGLPGAAWWPTVTDRCMARRNGPRTTDHPLRQSCWWVPMRHAGAGAGPGVAAASHW